MSPLTIADILSHNIIVSELNNVSNYPVISEEAFPDYEIRKNWKTLWLIDPLDGTKDFIAKNGDFTINIALLNDCKPVIGVIYAPAIDELYYGEKDKGAFVIRNGEHLRLPLIKFDAPIMARSRFHEGEKIEEFARLNSIKNQLFIGSALKFGRLAEGLVNIYPRYTGSKEWDIAAGHIILKEAGCRIIDLVTFAEPVYNKPHMKNNFFISLSKDMKFDNLKFPEV